MKVDYLIVGSGLTGAVIARLLVDDGREVVIVERRPHLGGNVYDHAHPSGIRVHTYGPHYFRTTSEKIWAFVQRFATFYPYEAALKSYVDGQYESWPITAAYIRRTLGAPWQPEFRGIPANFQEASLAMMPRLVYEKFVKGYTEKQWGVPAQTLAATLAARFDVHEDDEPRLKRHKYQGIPLQGYAHFMRALLTGIPLLLNFDYLQDRHAFEAQKLLIFTGPIDEFFGYEFGHLRYRGQQREHTYLPNVAYAQPCGQVNNPDSRHGPHIRTLEWKHMMPKEYADKIQGTVLTTETPFTPTHAHDFEYPFPDEGNAQLYARYRCKAEALPRLLICGRLGEYRYYDMDQAIARATVLAQKILEENSYPLIQGEKNVPIPIRSHGLVRA
ncbi:MAG: UDP-galactopyranose mutase [Caldilineaceae bacterium]